MPDQAASANIVADSTLTGAAGLTIVAEALLPTSAAMLGFAHTHARASVSPAANSSLSGTMHQGYAAHAPLGGNSSLSALFGNNEQGQAFIGGTSQVMANGYVHSHVAAPIVAGATLSPDPTANYKGQTLHITAGSSVAAHATCHWQAHANIDAGSTFTTWVIFTLSGTLSGAGSLAGTPIRVHLVSGAFGGAGSLTGTPVQTVILGAQFTGAGTLQDGLSISLSGTLSGAGAIHGTLYRILAFHPLPMVGSGGMHDSIPLPMVGFGTLSGNLEITRYPRPFCPPRHDKVFRWGYTLTRGDLELRVCDDSGNGFAPVVVLFAFYQIVAGGQRILVGPPNRRPAVDTSEGKVGRYYATGTAGELGQPGSWVVVWRFQRSWWTPTETFEEHFRVVDEVTSGDPGALYGRCRKYGWL